MIETRPPRPRRPRRPPTALLAAALLTVGALAACGRTTQVQGDGMLQVALTEYHVAPQSVRAPSGTLTIFVHNYGRLSHDLVISLHGRSEASTQPIAPGETTELIATLTPGRYLLASTILSDQALGAYGTLVVTSSPGVVPGRLCPSFSPQSSCPQSGK